MGTREGRALAWRALVVAAVCGAMSTLVAGVATQPVQAGSKAKARGAELFATKGCAHCHGEAGVGGGRGPDLQLVRKRRNAKSIAQQIHDGGMGMPPYGDELTQDQIKDLVAFLRAKRKFVQPPPKPAETAPAHVSE